MESDVTRGILFYTAISFLFSFSWLLHRGILICCKINLLSKAKKWLNKRSILIPTLAVFTLPIFTVYLTVNPIPDSLKAILPVITFAVGQFLGKQEKQSEIKIRQSEIILTVKRKFSVAQKKMPWIKRILQKELTLIRRDGSFIEERLQFLDRITEEFSKLDVFLDLVEDHYLEIDNLFLLREISTLIDEFNELIAERTDYRKKCRELVTTSVDQYLKLLEYTDEKLLEVSQRIEESMDSASLIEVTNWRDL